MNTLSSSPSRPLPWHFHPDTLKKPLPPSPTPPMVLPHPDDIHRVLTHYQKHPAIIHSQPYDIANIHAIRTPNSTRLFDGRLAQLEAKGATPFSPPDGTLFPMLPKELRSIPISKPKSVPLLNPNILMSRTSGFFTAPAAKPSPASYKPATTPSP